MTTVTFPFYVNPDGWIERNVRGVRFAMERHGKSADGKRDRFKWRVTAPDGSTEHGFDFLSPEGGCSLAEAFGGLIAFFGACYAERLLKGKNLPGLDFKLPLVPWMRKNEPALRAALQELQANPQLITEDK